MITVKVRLNEDAEVVKMIKEGLGMPKEALIIPFSSTSIKDFWNAPVKKYLPFSLQVSIGVKSA